MIYLTHIQFQANRRVIDGSDAGFGTFPWQVLLIFQQPFYLPACLSLGPQLYKGGGQKGPFTRPLSLFLPLPQKAVCI